jgi:hypothetical protein
VFSEEGGEAGKKRKEKIGEKEREGGVDMIQNRLCGGGRKRRARGREETTSEREARHADDSNVIGLVGK